MRRIVALIFLMSSAGTATIAEQHQSECPFGDDKVVPNVQGLTLEEAQATVEGCGFKWAYSEFPGTLSYHPIGTIGRQTPLGGQVLEGGDVVRGFISRGFIIPNYKGQHQSVPEAQLLDLGLNVVVDTERHHSEIGTVISHEPAGQAFFDVGTPIELLVSEGPWLLVPDLVGNQYHPASNQLAALGLSPSHGGGSLEAGRQPITNCESEVWYPVVDFTVPASGARLFEGDGIRIHTKKKTQFLFQPQPGQQCE